MTANNDNNFVSFYNYPDNRYLFYDFDRKKIYCSRGSNTFKPGIAYFISIPLTIAICNMLNKYYLPLSNILTNLILVIISVIVTSFFSLQLFRRLANIGKNPKMEIYIDKHILENYVLEGKNQFRKQKTIIFFTLFAFLIFIFLFIFYGHIVMLALIICIWFVFFITSLWVRPQKKIAFFKKYDEGRIEL